MLLYEINSRLNGLTFLQLKEELGRFKKLGFDALWLMGVWEISPLGIQLSKKYAPDFQGSPYAIYQYRFNPDLGTEEDFLQLRKQANALGIKIIVDFVPNHLALDTPLIDQHPEFFIQSDPRMRHEYNLDYYLHPSGRRLAHGKDPYFPGWTDTVQLNYTKAQLRAYMCTVLESIARLADGVRCDMAMLILRDQIKRQWFTRLSQAAFDSLMPHEFWEEAIQAARRVNPNFVMIAEAYWDTETKLYHLGFTYTYHKRLYDALVTHQPALRVNQHLKHTSDEFLHHSVHFIENHDEDRAAARFSKRATRRAAALILLLPGMPLIHQGQMEGITEKLPVQRIKLLEPYVPDTKLQQYYEELLTLASDPIFRKGEWAWADSNWKDAVCFWRRYQTGITLIAIPQGEEKIHVPERLEVSNPPAHWKLTTRFQVRNGWNRHHQLNVSFHKANLSLKRADVLKCINGLDILNICFEPGSSTPQSVE